MSELEFYRAGIEELLQECADSDLLSLIYNLLSEIEAEPSPSAPAQILVMFDERRRAA